MISTLFIQPFFNDLIGAVLQSNTSYKTNKKLARLKF